MLVTGIDPGKQGAIVTLNSNRQIARYSSMPTIGNSKKKKIAPAEIRTLLSADDVTTVFLESVFIKGKFRSRSSILSEGRNCYVIEGILAGLEIPYQMVQPKIWHKAVVGGDKRLKPKDRAFEKASQLWPQAEFVTNFNHVTKVQQELYRGMVDAALIADYGRLQICGAI